MSEKLFNWLYGVIVSPSHTLEEISKEKPLGMAILVYLAITILNLVTNIFADDSFEQMFQLLSEAGIEIHMINVVTIMFLASIVLMFVGTLATHLFARMFKGTGGYVNFLSAYLFTSFVQIFMVPFTFIGNFFGLWGMVLSFLASLGIMVWAVVLMIIAIRESYKLLTGTSVGVFFLTVAVFLIIVGIPFFFVTFSMLVNVV